jgi:hypothetical protein
MPDTESKNTDEGALTENDEPGAPVAIVPGLEATKDVSFVEYATYTVERPEEFNGPTAIARGAIAEVYATVSMEGWADVGFTIRNTIRERLKIT